VDYLLVAAQGTVHTCQVQRTLPVQLLPPRIPLYASGGSLEEIERLVIECLKEIGEQNISW
jgi:hypothetical protein